MGGARSQAVGDRRALVRTSLLLVLAASLLVPILSVAPAIVHFPSVLRHRLEPVRETALMRIRAQEAARAGRAWLPRQRWLPLREISPELVQAVLAAEDVAFYRHRGFDFDSLEQAWERGDFRGTSTITQQTVKNLYLSPARSVTRKLREAVLAWWMERCLPKDRILELYLNVVELGPGIFGVGAAAEFYFGEPAAALSRDRAALLAATLPAPLVENPAAPSPALRSRERSILRALRAAYRGVDVFAPESSALPGD